MSRFYHSDLVASILTLSLPARGCMESLEANERQEACRGRFIVPIADLSASIICLPTNNSYTPYSSRRCIGTWDNGIMERGYPSTPLLDERRNKMGKHLKNEVEYYYDSHPTEEDLMGVSSIHAELVGLCQRQSRL